MRRILRIVLIGFAALLAGYVIWDRVETYRLNRAIEAIAARGEPIDLSSLDAPLPSPQHVEAARLYGEAAARAREVAERDFGMGGFDVDAVVGRVDVPGWEDTYRKDAPALQLLDRATPLPFAGFGDTIEGPEWMNVQGLQSLSGLAALRADLLAYRGDGDGAVQSLIAAIRVQRTLTESLFNRYPVGMRQFGSLRILLRHAAPSAAALEALQRAFAELPDEDGIDRDLILQRARLIERRSDPFGMGGAAFFFHPFLTRMMRQQIEQFPGVIAAARRPWPEKYTTLTAMGNGEGRRSIGTPLRRAVFGPPMNLAALWTSPGAAGTNLAVRRVAVTTIAIERYRRTHDGALPPSLDALVPAFLPAVPLDPFSGKPVVFKPAADSYAVYSLDTNRMDDGGVFYGTGSMSQLPQPRTRDFGIKVPLTPNPVRGPIADSR